jgi:hypothetical protein
VDGAGVEVKVHIRQRLTQIGNLWWNGAAQLIFGQLQFLHLPIGIENNTTSSLLSVLLVGMLVIESDYQILLVLVDY